MVVRNIRLLLLEMLMWIYDTPEKSSFNISGYDMPEKVLTLLDMMVKSSFIIAK